MAGGILVADHLIVPAAHDLTVFYHHTAEGTAVAGTDPDLSLLYSLIQS